MYNLHLTTHTIYYLVQVTPLWTMRTDWSFAVSHHRALTLVFWPSFSAHCFQGLHCTASFYQNFLLTPETKENFWHLNSETSKSPFLTSIPSSKKSCSLSEIQMSNSDDKPIPKAFRKISNWFLPSPQFPWSAHLAVIIVTYNGDIKLKLSQCFKNYLRSVLGTKAAPKSLLPNYTFFFTRRWSALPCAQEKKKKNKSLPLITDNSNEPYKGNNGLFHAFDSLLQFKDLWRWKCISFISNYSILGICNNYS